LNRNDAIQRISPANQLNLERLAAEAQRATGAAEEVAPASEKEVAIGATIAGGSLHSPPGDGPSTERISPGINSVFCIFSADQESLCPKSPELRDGRSSGVESL
jgi:hypothetical protein